MSSKSTEGKTITFVIRGAMGEETKIVDLSHIASIGAGKNGTSTIQLVSGTNYVVEDKYEELKRMLIGG